MRRLFLTIALLCCFASTATAIPPITWRDEGTRVGNQFTVNCVGSGITCDGTTTAGWLTITVGGASLGNWTFSGNTASTSGSPTIIGGGSAIIEIDGTTSSGLFLNGTYGAGFKFNGQQCGLAGGTLSCYPLSTETPFFSVSSAGLTVTAVASAPTVKLTDAAAKGTCDATVPGTFKYEVVANVGTAYVCRQTGVGTYAWAALH